MFNRLEIIGFLGCDPEMKTLTNNRSFARLSVATKEVWNSDGEKRERVEWHTALLWGRVADVARFLKRGSEVFLAGPLRSREYEANGTRRRVWELHADTVRLLDRAGERGAPAGPPRREEQEPAPEELPREYADLPF